MCSEFVEYVHLLVMAVMVAGVHDSFWTHAGTVDKMNILLRKKFVQLYSQPILENVSALFTFLLLVRFGCYCMGRSLRYVCSKDVCLVG